MNTITMLDALEETLGAKRVKENFILAPYTSFKMGGKAEFYYEAFSREDLINAVKTSAMHHIPLTLLGGGSNVIVSDRGISGLVVRNLSRKKEMIKEDTEGVFVSISSGYTVSTLVKELVEEGLSGLEYHMGLPGTVGGALYMNSKWAHPPSFFGDQLVAAEVADRKGTVKTVDRAYFQFAYDFSLLQKTKEILLTATFFLKRDDRDRLKKRAREALEHRKKTQPFGVFSSGCFFKNIDGKSAGQLIDELGLKGFSMGDFSISQKHGNFIIHTGQGTMADLKKFLSVIKQKAKEKYGVVLEEEVIFLA